MGNVWSILVSAMLSGVFATIITLWWQNKSQLKKEKVRIFTVLMSKRYDVTAAECVESLNMIDVVFVSEIGNPEIKRISISEVIEYMR